MKTELNPIDLISNLKNKEISFLSLSTSNKAHYLKYREELMQELKDLCYNELIINYEEVFYLSVVYLDIIFIQYTNITIANQTIRDNFTISCLSLAIKMIGRLKRNIFKMIPFSDSTRKEYEDYCLQMLNYNLVYTTPYDYVNLMFGSNAKLFETAKNKLALAVFNSLYLNHSYFSIAMGVMNYSINVIKEPQRCLITYDKWIHSSEAEELRNLFKNIEVKKKKPFHAKVLSNINMTKRPDLNVNYNLTSRNIESNSLKQIVLTSPRVQERTTGNSQMKTNNDHNINKNRHLKGRNIYPVLNTNDGNHGIFEIDLKKIAKVNYCKLTYLLNQRIPLKVVKSIT